MSRKIISLAVLVLLLAMPIQMQAIKAYPFPVEMKQPDGKMITVKLNGDEFHRFYTTEDGYLLRKNEQLIYKMLLFIITINLFFMSDMEDLYLLVISLLYRVSKNNV